VALKGTLKLIDGTPVPGAELGAKCGTVVRTARTDHHGRFIVDKVPEGSCRITSQEARLDETVRVGSNVLRRNTEVQLTVPPMHRVVLEVISAEGKKTVIHLDETLRLEYPLITPLELSALKPGQELTSRGGEKTKLRVKSVRARAWMPLQLRGTPRGNEIFKIPLYSGGKLDHLKPATRQLIVIQRCDADLSVALDALESVVSAYATTGLKVNVIGHGRGSCAGQGRPLVPAYLGGDEALWALQARVGDLVLLDQDGRVLLRRPAIKGSALQEGLVEEVVAFLERSWPIFAAVRRVSLSQASSVKAAETERLVSQATEHLKARRYVAARRMLDRVLDISPDLAEAHKQQALIKARLGDYTGAMQEVSWWRTSFGSEAADDLLDEVQQACKGAM
jgi:hypothetical protein